MVAERHLSNAKTTPMRSFIRLLILGVAVLLFGSLSAQGPYIVYVYGQLEGANGQQVIVQTMPGTLPAQTVTATDTTDSFFLAVFAMDSPTGGFLAFSTCGNGTITADSSTYTLSTPLDTAFIEMHLTCSGDTSTSCQACLTVTQSTPFTAQFTSCTSGGTAPYVDGWLLPDGSLSIGSNVTYTFSGPGAYGVCMQSSDATGCTSVACDTVIVGADGTINPTDPIPCLAGFWMVQAYGDTSNGGNFLAPIPNAVWVLGLSSAIDGIDTYVWDFGDGNSSTEVYPTHQYDGPGPYQLCLTISNGNCSDTFCDTVSMDEAGLLNGMTIDGAHPIGSDGGVRSGGFTLTVLQALPTEVAKLPALVDLKLWPNPSQDELNVTLNSGYASKVMVTVIDLSGRTVLNMEQALALGSNQIHLDTAPLEEGLYLLRISGGIQSMTQRFLKVR